MKIRLLMLCSQIAVVIHPVWFRSLPSLQNNNQSTLHIIFCSPDKQADKLSRHRLKGLHILFPYSCVNVCEFSLRGEEARFVPVLPHHSPHSWPKRKIDGKKIYQPKLNQAQEGKERNFLRSETFI